MSAAATATRSASLTLLVSAAYRLQRASETDTVLTGHANTRGRRGGPDVLIDAEAAAVRSAVSRLPPTAAPSQQCPLEQQHRGHGSCSQALRHVAALAVAARADWASPLFIGYAGRRPPSA